MLTRDGNSEVSCEKTWIEDEVDDSVNHMVELIQAGQQFSASMFVGGVLPVDVADDRNDISDGCSTHDPIPGVNNEGDTSLGGIAKKKRAKGNDNALEEMKQYVDMKTKQSEVRMLKAIADSEGRITNFIAGAIAAATKGKSYCPDDSSGNVEHRTSDGPANVVGIDAAATKGKSSCGEDSSGNVEHTTSDGPRKVVGTDAGNLNVIGDQSGDVDGGFEKYDWVSFVTYQYG